MNKNLWLGDNWEPLPCPKCEYGVLESIEERYHSSETLDSLKNNEFYNNGIVYPESNYLCTEHLKCNKCSDIVIASYERIEDVRNTDAEGNEISIRTSIFYYPAPPIIKTPSSCPENIQSQLKTSFILYWVDIASCANKIRTAIERLLNHLNIPSKTTLHARIVAFQKANPKVGDYLLAIKWIGNAGSHDSTLDKKSVLDAYELLEYSLELLFNEREQNLNDISKRINTAKGPV